MLAVTKMYWRGEKTCPVAEGLVLAGARSYWREKRYRRNLRGIGGKREVHAKSERYWREKRGTGVV